MTTLAASANPKPAKRLWHPSHLLLMLAVWLATAGNLPLWLTLWRLPEMQSSHAALGALGLGVALAALLFSTLALLVWPRWLKAAGLLLLVAVSASSYFMISYGIVIDHTMVANVTSTDLHEVRDLLSPGMLLAMALGVVIPGAWLLRQRLSPVPLRALAPRQLGWALLALVVAVGAIALSFKDVASLMRNHKSLRYMINPYNAAYALGRHELGKAQRAQQPLLTIGTDAHTAARVRNAAQPPLIVLVIGETARAANFGLGGYARDTTPKLKSLQAQGGLVYYPNVQSCGTSTDASLPCMFSHLGKADFQASSNNHENLLDVLQHAGLSVLWLDNQSGCKGVCDRVAHAQVAALNPPGLCQDGECEDLALLKALPAQLALLETANNPAGTVVVFHQMGSHGPAYYKRSASRQKVFTPECLTNQLQECSTSSIVNAYDNSLRATDDLLARTIEWLSAQERPSSLVYVSDHGESLGEKGLYLHGMPYRFAPEEQTHVPMLTWNSTLQENALQLDMSCARTRAQQPWSHDALFHTVLELAQVKTTLFKPDKSVLATCTHTQVG